MEWKCVLCGNTSKEAEIFIFNPCHHQVCRNHKMGEYAHVYNMNRNEELIRAPKCPVCYPLEKGSANAERVNAADQSPKPSTGG